MTNITNVSFLSLSGSYRSEYAKTFVTVRLCRIMSVKKSTKIPRKIMKFILIVREL